MGEVVVTNAQWRSEGKTTEESYVSGDSRWVWLRGIRGSEVSASVQLAK